jgi:hypothetical protein
LHFYIYENWRAEKNGKAKVHKENCPHCNKGEGQAKNKESGRNGIWHPPFTSFESAWEAAVLMPNRKESCCNICNPEKG